jgi:serine/threonine protein kinase/tetratricopeptide (TPR) repeat protein
MIACPSAEELERVLNEEGGETGFQRIEAHVQTCLLCQETLERLSPAALPGATLLDAKRTRSISDSAGIPALPGYEDLEELGRGGMGVVCKALQTKPKRWVAVKMLRSGSEASSEDLIRFQREAEAVARLQHPNLVPIYEVGEHDGRPYFTMELMRGGSLKDWLKNSSTHMPCDEAARLVETLARAIHIAHQHGIVHRDLKPGNILLATSDQPLSQDANKASNLTADGRSLNAILKISDFGLAKMADGGADLTNSRAVLGTPSYMAPEQAHGKSKDIGPATDVYALGAILYEILTGRPPFRGETTVDILMLVRNEQPIPPRQLQTKMPLDLETICLKCLEKEEGRRYAGALELAEDLHRFCEGKPIRARPIGRAARLWRWCRRKPLVASLATAVIFLVVALIGGLLLSNAMISAERDQARSNFQAAETAREQAAANLRKAEAQQGARLEATFANRFQLPATVNDRQDPSDPEFLLKRAFELDLRGNQNNWKGNHDQAEKEFREALQLYEELVSRFPNGPYRLGVAECYYRLAMNYRANSQEREALKAHESGAAALETAMANFPDENFRRWRLLQASSDWPALLWYLGRLEESEIAYRQGLASAEELAKARYDVTSSYALAHRVEALARCLRNRRKLNEAEQTYRRALEVYEKHAASFPQTPLTANAYGVHHSFGQLLEVMNKRQEAESVYRKAIALEQVRTGGIANTRTDLEIGRILKSLGDLLKSSHRAQEADSLHGQAKGILQRVARERASHNISAAHTAWTLAMFSDPSFGNPDLTLKMAQDAVAVGKAKGQTRILTIWALRSLGLASYRAGEWRAAIAALNESMKMRHRGDSFDWFPLAMAHSRLGEKDAASEWFQKAVDWMEQYAPFDPELLQFRGEAAGLLRRE